MRQRPPHVPAMRVGLVTSDSGIVRQVRAVLPEPAFELFAVRSFFRGIDLLRVREVEVFIADSVMQGGSALALLDSVAVQAAPLPVPVRVLLHRDDAPGEPPRVDLAPADAIVRVPSQLEALPAIVRSILAQRGHPAALPSAPRAGARIARSATSAIEPIVFDTTPATGPEPQHASAAGARDVVARKVEPQASAEADAAAAQDTHGAAQREPERQSSGLLRAAPSFADFVAEIERRHDALPGQSYFEVLDVGVDVSQDALREVFDAASRRFHPDRNHALRQPLLRRKLEGLYASICEAYDVLSSPSRRERYEVERERHHGAVRLRDSGRDHALRLEALSEVAAAQRFLRLAQTAYDDGDRRSALQNLRFAIALDPGNAQLDARLRRWQEADEP